jgi:hypothetical protein
MGRGPQTSFLSPRWPQRIVDAAAHEGRPPARSCQTIANTSTFRDASERDRHLGSTGHKGMSAVKSVYEVGYGKPPKRTRFVKGKSGNLRGRPRKDRYTHRTQRTHLKDDILEMLEQRIYLSEQGHTKRITIQRATVKALVNHAIKGHSAAIASIWKLFKHYSLDQEPDHRTMYYRRTPSLVKLIDKALESVRQYEAAEAGIPCEGATSETDDKKDDPKEFLPKRVNIMDDLLLELQEQITMQERGKSKKITKQQALLMSLVTRVLRGNTTAFSLFWAMIEHYGLDEEPDKYLTYYRFPEHLDLELRSPRKAKKTYWPTLTPT